jgi:hypothetical protein
MSEYALWLKLAATQLVIRALEEGFVPEDCQLVDPLQALATVSADLSLKKPLPLRGGSTSTALDIQRSYLRMVQAYAGAHAVGDADVQEVISEWKTTLDGLESDPSSLADRLDWVAKYDLMDEAVTATGWSAVSRILPVIRYLEAQNLGLGRAIEKPDEVRSSLARRLGSQEFGELDALMTRTGLAWEDLPELYRLHYQLKKIDLRYHEVAEEGGYFLQMEQAGLFRRVVQPATIEKAQRTPPLETRATLRGYYVREALRLHLDALIGWERVIVPSRFKIIAMKDPGNNEAPVDLSSLQTEGYVWSILRAVFFLPHIVSPY